VAGTSKAGTTSLHNWLSHHPQLGSSKTKETRFFLTDNYPVPKPKGIGTQLSDYANYFKKEDISQNSMLLESTPDYLYGANPNAIKRMLPKSKVIIILRDPTDRFVSWYKYALQRSFIDSDCTLKQFFELQSNDYSLNYPIYRYALEQGNYTSYIDSFKTVYGDDLLVLNFNELANQPLALIQKVCTFANINSNYYTNYVFETKNKSATLKYPLLEKYYIIIRRTIAYHILSRPLLLALFRKINQPIKILLSKNRQAINQNTISKEHLALIKEYYR